MSTNLYDTLGIPTDATDEQSMSYPCLWSRLSLSTAPSAVRKAYKKRALQTHPDRAPPEQQNVAGDEFRKVPLTIHPLPATWLTHVMPGKQRIRST